MDDSANMRFKNQDACEQCHGSGWLVRTTQGIDTAYPCPACRTEQRKSRLLKSALIPPRYFEKGFDAYSPFENRSQERALRKALEYVERYPDVARGLVFVGPCGVGKTHLSVAILKALVQEQLISARFIDEAEFLRRLQFSYGPDSTDTERHVLLPLMEVDLLVWDDLGTGRATEWARETIRMVLNHRYTYNKQTILTTNRSVEDQPQQAPSKREELLFERIGHRLFSRLMEMCEVIEIHGPDARTGLHKAAMDFKEKTGQRRSRNKSAKFSSDALECPHCSDSSVTVLDESRLRHSQGKPYIDIFCRCNECNSDFLTRFFPETSEIKYPTLNSSQG